jgi:hypothetical protein
MDGWMYKEPEEVEEWDEDYERRAQDWEDYLGECRQRNEEQDRELAEKKQALREREEYYPVYEEGNTDEGCGDNKGPQPTTDNEEDFGTPYTHNEGLNCYTTPPPTILDSYETKRLLTILLMPMMEPSRGKIHMRVHTCTKREQAQTQTPRPNSTMGTPMGEKVMPPTSYR